MYLANKKNPLLFMRVHALLVDQETDEQDLTIKWRRYLCETGALEFRRLFFVVILE